jgi:epoxyqueuosine reductase QueG
MPRPKSEITGKQIQITVRVTASQREAFKELGGAAWLRKQLSAEIERRWRAEHAGLGTRIINRVFAR